MKYPEYMAMPNVDHIISGQGTAISTLDHSTTTSRVNAYISSYPSSLEWAVVIYASHGSGIV